MRGPASIGGALELEIWGPAGGSATILWAAALDTPVDTPFGQFDLDSEMKAAFTEDDELQLVGIADKLAEQIAAERREAS